MLNDKRTIEEIEERVYTLFKSTVEPMHDSLGFSGFLRFLQNTVETYESGRNGVKPEQGPIAHKAGVLFMEHALQGLSQNLKNQE